MDKIHHSFYVTEYNQCLSLIFVEDSVGFKGSGCTGNSSQLTMETTTVQRKADAQSSQYHCTITTATGKIGDRCSLLTRRLHDLDDLVHNAGIRKLLALLATHPTPEEMPLLTVDVSPNESSSLARILRSTRRMILPDLVLGRSSMMKTAFGAAKGPMDLRTCMTRSFRTWSFVSLPSLRATKALTACPVSSSLIPTTAASATWSVHVQ